MIPELISEVKGLTKQLGEVATLLRDNAVNQVEIKHLKDSDRKQWEKLDEISKQSGKWLHTVTASVISGSLVGLALFFVNLAAKQ